MTRGTTPTIHRDVIKIGAIVSEVQRDVVQILKGREDNNRQNEAVSVSSLTSLLK